MTEALTPSAIAPDARLALPGDIPGLHRLIESAYRGDSARRGWSHEADLLGGQRTDAESLAAILADPAQAMLVLALAGDIIGCVSVADRGGGIAYLGLLTVDPDRQAAGLGRHLLAIAEDHAMRAFAARRMEMTVIRQRGELIAYYERRGYARTGEERPFPYGDARFGEPRTDALAFVVLERMLAAAR